MKRNRFSLVLFVALLGTLLSGCAGAIQANSWPGVTVDKDVAYISYISYVYAVNLTNGQETWRYPEKADNKKQFYAAPAIASGQVVAGDYNKVIFGLNAADGKEKWSFDKLQDRVVGSGLAIDGLVLVPSTDHHLYALDANGAQKWALKTGGPIWAQPVTDGKTAFVASMDHFLYAVNPADGSVIWKTDVGSAVMYSLALSEDKSTLFVGTVANKIYAVNAADGKVAWQVSTGGNVWSPVVQHGDAIYFGDQSSKIYSLAVKDGAKNWEQDAGAAVIGSPAVLDNGLAFPTENGVVLAVDFNGKKLWNQTVNGKLYSNLVFTSGHIIVPVTSGDKNLLLVSLNPNGTQTWEYTPK